MISQNNIKNALGGLKFTCHPLNLYSANFQGNASRLYKVKYDNHVFKVYSFTDIIVISTGLKISLAFSINIPDKICSINIPHQKVAGKRIYTTIENKESICIYVNLIKHLIEELHFEDNEGLIVYSNNVELVINSTDKIIQGLTALSSIRKIIEAVFPDRIEEKIDISKIPRTLRPLLPVLQKWGISDDQLREEKIETTSKEDLISLTNFIDSYISEINQFLDNFGDAPLSHEAMLMGNLAELSDEIKHGYLKK